jgi:hypothetical protein
MEFNAVRVRKNFVSVPALSTQPAGGFISRSTENGHSIAIIDWPPAARLSAGVALVWNET